MSDRLYQLFGLRVGSELPLPELLPATGGGDADVHVKLATVAPDREGRAVAVDGEAVVMTVDGVACYRIAGGNEILVDPAPGATARNIRLYLLGSAMGAVLHQRGLLPLHANAVAVDGKAVAFLGHSGAGKSTLAAWFHDRGYPILADDVCCVAFAPEGEPIAHGGVPRLRLWRDALEQGGRHADDYELSHDAFDKYDVPTPAGAAPGPLPLARVYLLARTEPGEQSAIERLTGVDSVSALVANTYRGAFARLLGHSERHLAACLALARAVPIYRARRAWARDAFDDEAERIQAHVREAARAVAGASIP